MTLPVKASMWYLACSVLQKAIGFLTTPIFTRVMGTSDFGVVSLSFAHFIYIMAYIITP